MTCSDASLTSKEKLSKEKVNECLILFFSSLLLTFTVINVFSFFFFTCLFSHIFSVFIFFDVIRIINLYTVGEVGEMPKLGQSRKSRLRRHGKEWKKSVHGDMKL